MGFTPEQIKGRIKSVAKQNNADARTLMRIYMMERFLERLEQSEYRDNFIIKGGILVTAMIGVAHRSTMDICSADADERPCEYLVCVLRPPGRDRSYHTGVCRNREQPEPDRSVLQQRRYPVARYARKHQPCDFLHF